MRYHVRYTALPPSFPGTDITGAWLGADVVRLDSFRPEGSDHRPRTEARLLYTTDALHCLFTVDDRYVTCRHTRFNDMVCNDSCVELFIQPAGARGYVNVECNCGGTLHASFITDWRRTPDGFAAFRRLTAEEGDRIRIAHSLPSRVIPERAEHTVWAVQIGLPFSLLLSVTGATGHIPGAVWRGNLYKCADRSTHPHWASWCPVDELSFHLPRCFGEFCFEDRHLV